MKGIRPLHQPILQAALHLRGRYRPLPIATSFIAVTVTVTARKMSSQREDSIPHELRTAAEPRQNRLYPVRLSHVEQINPSIRLLQLAIPQENNVCLRLLSPTLRDMAQSHLELASEASSRYCDSRSTSNIAMTRRIAHTTLRTTRSSHSVFYPVNG